MHGAGNVTALLTVEIVDVVLHLSGRDVRVHHSAERHARRRGLLVPDLQIFGPLFGLFALLLFGLPRYEYLLIVKLAEGRRAAEGLLGLRPTVLLSARATSSGCSVSLARRLGDGGQCAGGAALHEVRVSLVHCLFLI